MALACAGKFFEGMVVFMTGVALPLISIEFALKASDKNFVTAASLAGSCWVPAPWAVWRTGSAANRCSSWR